MKSKGPDDNQVNAIAGFGHQIMRKPFQIFSNHINYEFIKQCKHIIFLELVDEIEKEKKEEEKA